MAVYIYPTSTDVLISPIGGSATAETLDEYSNVIWSCGIYGKLNFKIKNWYPNTRQIVIETYGEATWKSGSGTDIGIDIQANIVGQNSSDIKVFDSEIAQIYWNGSVSTATDWHVQSSSKTATVSIPTSVDLSKPLGFNVRLFWIDVNGEEAIYVDDRIIYSFYLMEGGFSTSKICSGGVAKNVIDSKVCVGGTLKDIVTVHTKVGGVLKQC